MTSYRTEFVTTSGEPVNSRELPYIAMNRLVYKCVHLISGLRSIANVYGFINASQIKEAYYVDATRSFFLHIVCENQEHYIECRRLGHEWLTTQRLTQFPKMEPTWIPLLLE